MTLFDNEPCCCNCNHYRVQSGDPDEPSYGTCAMDPQLLVSDTLYCPSWDGDGEAYLESLARAGMPIPDEQDGPMRVITHKVSLRDEQVFALERDKRMIPTLARQELEEYAAAQCERVVELTAIADWLLGLPTVQAQLVQNPSDPNPDDAA